MKLIATHLLLLFLVASALAWLDDSGRARTTHSGSRSTDRPTFVVRGSRIEAVPVEGGVGSALFATWSPATDRATLLLVFAQGCHNCDRVAGSWRELISFVRPPDTGPLPIDVVLLSTNPTADASRFVEENDLEGKLLVADFEAMADDRGFELLVPFDTVPQTILLEPGGRVARSRVGVLDGEAVLEWIEAMMDMVDLVAKGW